MENLEGEIWKVIKEADHYEVSNFGRFKRNRGTCYKDAKKEIQTTPIGPVGYPRKYLKDLKINVNIHRLVAEAFIPNPENKPFVNHVDGNKANNHVSNLEWSTPKENLQHASKMGLLKFQYGEDGPRAKLTWLQVGIIREALAAGHRPVNIARYFRVTDSTIHLIKSNKNWVI